uniref:Uncharacterized protein n=1 Tax=Amphimedon queenslandica TaxID=400682 RepID=A0A1X7T2Q7_AMPQE
MDDPLPALKATPRYKCKLTYPYEPFGCQDNGYHYYNSDKKMVCMTLFDLSRKSVSNIFFNYELEDEQREQGRESHYFSDQEQAKLRIDEYRVASIYEH